MGWRTLLSAVLRLGQRGPGGGAAEALRSAERSYARAVVDRCMAAQARAEAEVVEARAREHNVANRFDDFLHSILRGEG